MYNEVKQNKRVKYKIFEPKSLYKKVEDREQKKERLENLQL